MSLIFFWYWLIHVMMCNPIIRIFPSCFDLAEKTSDLVPPIKTKFNAKPICFSKWNELNTLHLQRMEGTNPSWIKPWREIQGSTIIDDIGLILGLAFSWTAPFQMTNHLTTSYVKYNETVYYSHPIWSKWLNNLSGIFIFIFFISSIQWPHKADTNLISSEPKA